MCIAIATTAHPDYPLILLNNRDEYLHRPTASADWWPEPDSHVLGGRDMHRPEHGTWLGVTKQGRIAVLTNFREEGVGASVIQGARSRGGIVNAFLKTPPGSHELPEEWARRLVEEGGTKGVGGFSLMFGRLNRRWVDGGVNEMDEKRGRKGLAIVSNRTPDVQGLIWLGETRGETHALSNSHYGDRSWPKTVDGEGRTASAISASVEAKETEDQLLERLFDVLSVNTLPMQREGEDWEIYLNQLRNSIFIPPVGRDELLDKAPDEVAAARARIVLNATSGIYGTQKQSVILIDKQGKLTFVERTLIDESGNAVPKKESERKFAFNIEGW
ncbi:NRDE protein-domain-containing protein [Lineolata rhizophorae]|uniref:NRDE protein-domain-containing protein n=1 Tax=Lineolata rhizophorae TaxID=578093 RepID=A0A6A6NPG0_9PEZI|nr:NRDE protein-domain-containing protein [Lineolata rhizophorae]